MATAEHLAAAVQAALDTRPGTLVIDLTGVGFLGSTGLAVLAAARHTAAETGQTLRVVIGDRHPVVRPLTTSGLADHLDLFRELDHAFAHPHVSSTDAVPALARTTGDATSTATSR